MLTLTYYTVHLGNKSVYIETCTCDMHYVCMYACIHMCLQIHVACFEPYYGCMFMICANHQSIALDTYLIVIII